MNFGNLLAKTLSSVTTEREEATRQLENAAKENLAGYLVMLCQELANEQQQVDLRTAAGLALKNALTAREYGRREQLSNQWIALDQNAKIQVKQGSLVTLNSAETRAGTAAAQVIAAIAAIELPRQEWPDLIKSLLSNVTSPGSSSNLKQSTLQTIGFICEEIDPHVLEAQSDQILTAVIQGARKEETSQSVRHAAITALYNSLEFVRNNFEREDERNYIMQVVCEATQSSDHNVVVASFESLVKIMQLYYDKMHLYMQKALFGLTIQGMKSDDARIALQAIEFWSTVCDEEINLAVEAAECRDMGEQPEQISYEFAKHALSEVVPVLLWLLTKQEEDDDEDEWNVAMASATCLSLLAQAVEDIIVGPVVPFVEKNIRSPDWRYREAAVMAFGSILEGPNSVLLQPLVDQAFPVLIEMTKDPMVQVKDTTAWTLGRVSELLPDCIHDDVHLPSLIQALVLGLEDSPRVASNCAWSMMNLSESKGQEDLSAPSYALSKYFEAMVTALMRATEREDGTEANLRTSAYEALSNLLQMAAADCLPIIEKSALIILDRLDASIAMENQLLGADDKLHHGELQVALCGTLQSIERKLGKRIVPLSDRIMTAFLKIFNSGAKTTSTVEDAFLAIGVLINALEQDFLRYMEPFFPFLTAALQNHEEHQLCSIAVGIVGDLCRALNENILPYCDHFMTLLLQNLQSTVLHRDVKPPILSCFGDIALAIQGKFEMYLSVCLTVLAQACQIQYSPDMQDYVNQLREGILEAYTGIVQGLKADSKANLLGEHVHTIFQFLKVIYEDPEKNEAVLRGGVGLLGDLADSLGPSIKHEFANDWVDKFIKNARSRGMSPTTTSVAKWARDMIKGAIAGANTGAY